MGGVVGAEAVEGVVEEDADVRDREFGDAADFLVAETVLELQADDFLFGGGQRGD